MISARRAVALLATAQALLLTNGVLLVAVNGLAGFALASEKRFATLPIVTYVLGSALSTVPASHFMRHFGRRAGFILGAIAGIAGGALGGLAMAMQSFGLLLAATFLSGIYQAFGQYLRFAAAEVAPADFKSRAISLTLAGGVVGGFIGPWLARQTIDLTTTRFLASYASLSALALLAMVIAASLRFPPRSEEEVHGHARPLAQIACQPAFLVAVLAATVGYGVMNLLMSATPLAMEFCGLGFGDASFVLQWHVIGMFAPSFITGWLITRFGLVPILALGTALYGGCIGIALAGQTLAHFWWSLLLLGIGWNFLFVGGTTLLTEAYLPAEKAKTQGLNDFLVFAVMAASSFTSGVVITSSGWDMLNQLAIPLVALTLLAVGLFGFARKRAREEPV